MLTTKRARRVLTKAEQRHLTVDANVHSMATLRSSRAQQLKWEKDGAPESCQTCAIIARKLGLEKGD